MTQVVIRAFAGIHVVVLVLMSSTLGMQGSQVLKPSITFDRNRPLAKNEEQGFRNFTFGHINATSKSKHRSPQEVTGIIAGYAEREPHEQVVTLRGHTRGVACVAFYPPNGLASGSHDGTVKLWDLATHECVATLDHPESRGVLSVACSPDGRTLVAGLNNGVVSVWEIVTRKRLMEIKKSHADRVTTVAINPKAQQVVSGSADRTIRVWDIAPRSNWRFLQSRCMRVLADHDGCVSSVAISPKGKEMVSGSYDKTVRLWNLETGACIKEIEKHTEPVTSVAYSLDGHKFASGSVDRTVHVCDSRGESLEAFPYGIWINALAFSPQGQLVVGSEHGKLRLGDRVEEQSSPVNAVACSPDGHTVAVALGNGTIRLLYLHTDPVQKIFKEALKEESERKES